MARIIESIGNGRRIIKLSTEDIISVVQDYQRIVTRHESAVSIRNLLQDKIIYIPEDV